MLYIVPIVIRTIRTIRAIWTARRPGSPATQARRLPMKHLSRPMSTIIPLLLLRFLTKRRSRLFLLCFIAPIGHRIWLLDVAQEPSQIAKCSPGHSPTQGVVTGIALCFALLCSALSCCTLSILYLRTGFRQVHLPRAANGKRCMYSTVQDRGTTSTLLHG